MLPYPPTTDFYDRQLEIEEQHNSSCKGQHSLDYNKAPTCGQDWEKDLKEKGEPNLHQPGSLPEHSGGAFAVLRERRAIDLQRECAKKRCAIKDIFELHLSGETQTKT